MNKRGVVDENTFVVTVIIKYYSQFEKYSMMYIYYFHIHKSYQQSNHLLLWSQFDWNSTRLLWCNICLSSHYWSYPSLVYWLSEIYDIFEVEYKREWLWISLIFTRICQKKSGKQSRSKKVNRNLLKMLLVQVYSTTSIIGKFTSDINL